MADKARKHISYLAQKRERHKILRTVLTLLCLLLLYNIITTLVISVWVLHNDTMQPGLRAGDRFLVSSSTWPRFVADIRQSDTPFRRGSIVLIDTRQGEGWFLIAADSVVRFFTAQKLSIFRTEEHLHIKRLVALPGDEVYLSNYIIRVRPAGGDFTFTEFELSDRPYHPTIPQVPALWDESLPLSGNMERIVLGPGECFVISDDRSSSADSRTWGPIDMKTISGRLVFRFWPLARMGRP